LRDKFIIDDGLSIILCRKLISRSNPQDRFLRGFDHPPVARITVVFPIFPDGISTKSFYGITEKRISLQTDRNWNHFKSWIGKEM